MQASKILAQYRAKLANKKSSVWRNWSKLSRSELKKAADRNTLRPRSQLLIHQPKPMRIVRRQNGRERVRLLCATSTAAPTAALGECRSREDEDQTEKANDSGHWGGSKEGKTWILGDRRCGIKGCPNPRLIAEQGKTFPERRIPRIDAENAARFA